MRSVPMPVAAIVLVGVITLALLLVQAAKAEDGSGDVTPPGLSHLELSPTSVDVQGGSASVTVTFHVIDDMAGLANASAGFRSPGKTQVLVAIADDLPITGNPKNGEYRAILTIPQFSEAGTWFVESVFLRDTTGNLNEIDTIGLAAKGFETELIVESLSDTIPPHLVGISFSPATVDVSNDPGFTLATLHVTDTLAGVSTGSIVLRSPSGAQFTVGAFHGPPASGDPGNGEYRIYIGFPQFAEAGVWDVESVFLMDAAGNTRETETVEQLTVSSQVQDLTPPNVEELHFSEDSVSVQEGPDSLSVEVRISDDLSGFLSATAGFISPSGRQVVATVFTGPPITGHPANGTVESTLDMPQFSEPGIWVLNTLFATDTAGNSVQYDIEELRFRAFPTRIAVSLKCGDADNSGAVELDARDAVEVLKYVVGRKAFSEAQLFQSNVTGGEVNAADAGSILRSVGEGTQDALACSFP